MPGTYTFRPIQANLTHDTDWLGKMDPYCSYRTGATRIKGPVCRNGGKFPKWEDAAVNVPALNEPSIVVDLMDKETILFDDNIGSFVIDLQEVQSKGQVSKWYPVYWKQKPAGEILMEAAFQPEFIQQQPVFVEQPVIVKETVIEKPVIVEKVVEREFIEQPQVHTTHQEFHSGPIIHGISQIHHGGQGIGLVPQHGGIINQGTHIHQGNHIQQGTHIQQGSTIHHGSHLAEGGLQQGVLGQGSLNQGQFTQGGLTQGVSQGLHQGEFNQGGLTQGVNQGLHQGNVGQGLNQGLNQGNLGQGGLNQGKF